MSASAARSTGPITPEGKARSSRNALKLGLFTAEAFVLPEEREQYETMANAFWTQLQPQGALEETYTMEILRAAWRLERCGKIEASLCDALLDGALDEAAIDRKQIAVDRARAQSNNTIRKATAELRRLQTNREIAAVTIGAPEGLGLSNRREVIAALHADAKAEKTALHLNGIDGLAGLLEYTDNQRTQQFLANQAKTTGEFVL